MSLKASLQLKILNSFKVLSKKLGDKFLVTQKKILKIM